MLCHPGTVKRLLSLRLRRISMSLRLNRTQNVYQSVIRDKKIEIIALLISSRIEIQRSNLRHMHRPKRQCCSIETMCHVSTPAICQHRCPFRFHSRAHRDTNWFYRILAHDQQPDRRFLVAMCKWCHHWPFQFYAHAMRSVRWKPTWFAISCEQIVNRALHSFSHESMLVDRYLDSSPEPFLRCCPSFQRLRNVWEMTTTTTMTITTEKKLRKNNILLTLNGVCNIVSFKVDSNQSADVVLYLPFVVDNIF